MTTGATGQLGLALPVQGELSGTWGDTVNNGITEYNNIAIAGTLSFAGDGAITLANTTGDASATNIGSTTAQYMVIRITGTQTVTKVITGPSYSKLYMVDHAGATSAVTFKAAGQTGVSIAVGEKCFVYYNGTDYVKIATSTAGTGTVTAVSVVSANGLAGSSSGGATPALTLSTSITGVLKGNGTAISAATAGTDYVTPTGTETLTNKTIEAGTFTNGYTEEVATANTSTAYTIDLANGSVQILTLTGNCTYTFPTPVAGKSFILVQIQDATGSRTVTWPSTVDWPSATAPTLTATASKVDKFVFTAISGTAWLGSVAGQNYTV